VWSPLMNSTQSRSSGEAWSCALGSGTSTSTGDRLTAYGMARQGPLLDVKTAGSSGATTRVDFRKRLRWLWLAEAFALGGRPVRRCDCVLCIKGVHTAAPCRRGDGVGLGICHLPALRGGGIALRNLCRALPRSPGGYPEISSAELFGLLLEGAASPFHQRARGLVAAARRAGGRPVTSKS